MEIKKILVLAFVLFLSVTNVSNASELKLGDMFHITGCENSELLVPVVNMWDRPGSLFSGAQKIGELSGTGKKKCQGVVVKLLETGEFNSRLFLHIESIVNGNKGWITDSFVGKKFKRSRCKKHFNEEKYIARCIGK